MKVEDCFEFCGVNNLGVVRFIFQSVSSELVLNQALVGENGGDVVESVSKITLQGEGLVKSCEEQNCSPFHALQLSVLYLTRNCFVLKMRFRLALVSPPPWGFVLDIKTGPVF